MLTPDHSGKQPFTFDEFAQVPFDVEGAVIARHVDDTIYASNPATGAVVLFDLSGTIVGSTAVPASMDNVRLRDVALGPENTVYALYADDAALTVVASTFESPSREVRRWSYGSDIAIVCDAFCYLVPLDDGFGWEGGETVPYLNAAGAAITGPARPTDPAFGTEWETQGDALRTVTVTGPLDHAGAIVDSPWSVRLEDVVFNNDLGRSFEGQVDGSYTALVVFEREFNVRESRALVFLWLRSNGSVVALDADDFDGLVDVIVRPGDEALIGLAKDDQGLHLGVLRPSMTG